ncbi:MAG: hypothetical protein OER92_06390, partial [Alphaproteobacteria bacterium]|nr:hypothetical protein [Alphaproteobacteria bacterium]
MSATSPHIQLARKPSEQPQTHPSIDKVGFAMARPLSSVEYSQLRSICPRAKQKLLKLRFQWRRTWQLILPQPTDDALRFIASLTDIWLSTNQLELALDYVFSDPVSTEILFDYFACHLLLKWHGNRRV